MDNLNIKTIILMILCINITLFLSGFELINIGDQNIVEHFVDVDGVGENISIDENFGNMTENLANPNRGFLEGAIASLIDPLLVVVEVLVFIVNIIFAPIALFTNIPNLPPQIALMVGLPILVALFISIFYFIRGLN